MVRQMRPIIWRRWSHVGRRPVTVGPDVHVELMQKNDHLIAPFGKTPITKIVKVAGPLGALQFPVHRGLAVSMAPGPIPEERLLKVEVDNHALEGMSKPCRKFVQSMWGTTASILRQHVEGVTEVNFGASTIRKF